MATNPTINGKTLSTGGTNTEWGPPRPRITMSSQPSVDGASVQRFGHGPATLTGSGSISAASHAAIKAAIRTIQNATNHAPSTYVDSDNVNHENCILLDYRQVGRLNRESATSFWVEVVWTVLKQVAD